MKLNSTGRKLLLLGILSACLLTSHRSKAQVLPQDSLALVAFYQSTSGTLWNNDTNWLSTSVGLWHGVSLTGNRVTSLILGNNNMNGQLPAAIGNLTALEHLELDSNAIRGSIPTEIALLSNLDYLDLSRNQFSGSVPVEFNNLDSLSVLMIQSNFIENLPDLTGMYGLSFIDVQNNFLTPEDLEPNVGLPGFQYSGQYDFGQVEYISLNGQNVTISKPIDGSFNSYLWFHNGDTIPGQTTDTYQITGSTQAHEGEYQLVVFNSLLSMNFYSAKIHLGWSDNFYWIGDGGIWDDMSHWSHTSGGTDTVTSLPTIHDNVIFDDSSFTVAGQLVVIPDDGNSIGRTWRTMDWRGVTNMPTFRIRASTSQWITNNMSGSLYFDTNMTIDFHKAELQMNGSSNYEIDTKGHYLGQDCWLAFNYGTDYPPSPVDVSLLSDINHAIIYVLEGNLNTNGHNITVQPDGYFWIRNIGSQPATVDVSGSVVNGGSLNVETGASLIDDSATRMSFRNSFSAAGLNLNHVHFIGDVSMTFAGNNTFDTLEISAGDTIRFAASSTQTIHNLITNGSPTEFVHFQSTTPGVGANISKPSGTTTVDFASISDINAEGGATYNAYNSINGGNNPGWNFIYTNSAADSTVLADFYMSNGGATWFGNTNWITQPLELWNGVTVEAGRVVSLSLSNNNVTGEIPASLGQLSELKYLDLGFNQLVDSIPVELFNLVKLETFGLAGNNNLRGSMHPNIGNMTQLLNIWWDGNQLSGAIPAEIGNLTNLQNLFIQNNKFSGAIPSEFTNLEALANFDIQNNEFTILPDLALLPNISSGAISGNFFTFHSLVPNVSVPGITAFYMKEIPVGDTLQIAAGSAYELAFNAGDGTTTYQWMSEIRGTLAGETDSTLVVASASSANSGVFRCQASHPGVAFSLSTNNFYVEVIGAEAAEESGYTFQTKIGAEKLGLFQYKPGRIGVNDAGEFVTLDQLSSHHMKFNAAGSLDYEFVAGSSSDFDIDESGALFLADEATTRLTKYSPTGDSLFSVADNDSGWGLAINPDGSVLVMSRFSNKVRRFDSETGQVLDTISLTGGPMSTLNIDMEVDQDGIIYAMVPDYVRIDKFTPAGAFISSIDLSTAGLGAWSGMEFAVTATGGILFQTFMGQIHQFEADGTYVGIFAPNEITTAYGIDVAAAGIYVADQSRGVMLFDTQGVLIELIGPQLVSPGQFNDVKDIAINEKHQRLVADYGNGRVQVFNKDGDLHSIIGSQGTGPQQLVLAKALDVDADGNVFVVDNRSNRIQKYQADGTHMMSIGTTGAGDGQFNDPTAITISKSGFLFVADRNNDRIQKFSTEGAHLLSFGSTGTAPGQFDNIVAIVAEHDGNILVVDNAPTPRIQRFDQNGAFISGSQFNMGWIESIDCDHNGFVYVSSSGKVIKLDKNLNVVTRIGTSSAIWYQPADGDINGAHAVATNASGDTVWIASHPNRISIFFANFRFPSAPDSLALVDFYNSTNGSEWTDTTNWLQGPLHTWYGVTISGGKIRSISLPGNNLTGTLSPSLSILNELDSVNLSGNAITGQLPSLIGLNAITLLDVSENQFSDTVSNLPPHIESVDLSNNRFTALNAVPFDVKALDISFNDLNTLGNLTGTTLQKLIVYENKLTFEDLEPNIPIADFQYAPQDSIGETGALIKEINDTTVFEYIVGGASNQYQWMKNGQPIDLATISSFTINGISLEDDAFYNLHITNPALPDLTLKTFETELRVSSLYRDSLALVKIFESTNGTLWENNTGWADGTALTTWAGVFIDNNRVTQLDLHSNNLDGSIPADVTDMQSLTTLDLSDNHLTKLPLLTSMPALSLVNVSANNLDFASLIGNAMLDSINYANQAPLGDVIDTLVHVGTDFDMTITTEGTGNQYAWTYQGELIPEATDSIYRIQSIGRSNMGEYQLQVTNPGVPDLTLSTPVYSILATASISGQLRLHDQTGATSGVVRLFKITAANGYDTLGVDTINAEGFFDFPQVILDDYQLLGFADTIAHPDALPTYFTNKLFWEEADTLYLNTDTVGIDIVAETKPIAQTGNGVISGYLQEDDGTGGRRAEAMANKRVQGAGVSARKVERGGRGKEDNLVLVAYVFTNENGEFNISNLLSGDYRLNIQYPGYPMDTTSFTTITIGDALQSIVQVEANVVDGMISVRKLTITEIWGRADYQVDIFPNPTASFLHFNFLREEQSRVIKMVDLQGKTVIQSDSPDKEAVLDVQAVPQGFYLINIREKGKTVKALKVRIE